MLRIAPVAVPVDDGIPADNPGFLDSNLAVYDVLYPEKLVSCLVFQGPSPVGVEAQDLAGLHDGVAEMIPGSLHVLELALWLALVDGDGSLLIRCLS